MPDISEQLEAYQQLSEEERELLRLMAYFYTGISKNTLLRLAAKRLGVPTNRTDGLKKKAGRLFQWLEKRSLVESLPRQEKVISKEFKWALFEEELGSRKQTETIKLIQESVSFSHLRINLSLMGDGDLRDFVFLALTGEARPHSALENYLKGWGNYWNLKEKLEKVFGSPLWEWGVSRLPRSLQITFYSDQLLECITRTWPADQALELHAAAQRFLKQREERDLWLQSLLQLQDWLMGRPSLIDEGDRSEVTDWEGFLLKGMAQLRKGKLQESIEQFELGIKLFRKSTRKRSQFPEHASMLLYGLALLLVDHPEAESQLSKMYNKLPRSHIFWPIEIMAECLEVRRNFSQGEIILDTDIAEGEDGLPFVGVVFALIAYCLDLPMESELIPSLKKLSESGKWEGWAYLQMENATVLGKVLPEGEEKLSYQEEGKSLSKRLNMKSLFHAVQKKPAWELHLSLLEEMLGIGKAADTLAVSEKQERLVWIVSVDDFYLEPKIQKQKKGGGWTKGRKVALKRLAEREIPDLSPEDLRIIDALEATSRYYGYYGDYNVYDYFWNQAKAMLALPGHPRLFLASSQNTPLEVVAVQPQVFVNQQPDGALQIELDVWQADAGVYLKKETPTRYLLMQVTEAHERLFTALDGMGKLHVPPEGRDRILATLPRLTELATVHSDLSEQEAELPVVPADPRPHLHLIQIGDGFLLEALVAPFGSGPPYFSPGSGRSLIMAAHEGEQRQVQRDLAAEEAAVAEVKAASEALRFSLQTDTYQWELSNPASCLQFLLEIKPLLEDQKLVLEWPKGEKIRLTHQADLSQLALKVRSRRDWFELEGELRLDDKLVLSLKELLKAVKHAQGDFVEVSEGQYLALTRSLRRHLEKLGGVTFEEGEKQKFSRLAAASLEDVLEEAGALETSKAWRDTLSRMREARDLLFHLPSTFKAELRPYQQEGFQWLMRLAHWQVGACLADDMGLGKTIQALAAILARAELGPAMVVAPASVVRNWRSECERFAPTLNPIIFGEGDRAETMRQLGPYDLLLVSYGLLPSEAERLTEAHFATLVLDEAQAIKNRATKRSRVAMQLQADFRIATTGTPIENHLGELHNLFRFLNPGLLGTQKQFQEQFAIPIERNRDEERQKHLRQLIRPFVLRRRKSEVLEDLPPKTEISLSIDLSSEEMALYEAIRQEALESLADADLPAGQQHLQILAQLTRMRQACCHPQLINPKLKFDSAKLRVFDEIVEELRENGHKALIFSQFVSYLKLIEKRVKAKGIPYQYLDGSTPSKQREKRIQAFQRGEGDLFLISLKAGGTGINLTAADYVIHMDPWWNPAVEDQASDRAHRIGQNRPVTIYRLVTAQTIEEKIVRLHHEKRELADSLLSGTDLSAKLNAEELLALIREG